MRRTSGRRGLRLVLALRAIALVAAAVVLSACGDESPSTAPMTTPPRSPKELCLRGVHREPPATVHVHRALIVPLSRVKNWVLSTAPEIDWQTFSSSLAHAPLNERVGVCVLTKKDGKKFDPGGGEKPVQSIVAIVRPNGESTVFEIGNLASNLATTPTNFSRYR